MESFAVKGLFIALILAIALHAFALKYTITTPIVNRLATETYVIDKWTGNTWFCQDVTCQRVML